jgi:prepilin-type N-terminal cleavage/methylation domain-containing protein
MVSSKGAKQRDKRPGRGFTFAEFSISLIILAMLAAVLYP